MEPHYTGQYVVWPGHEHAEIIVTDPAGHRVVEHELPIDATGRAAWDWALHVLGWRRTGTWEPDELGYRCAVERGAR